jgi:hypothetical protein
MNTNSDTSCVIDFEPFFGSISDDATQSIVPLLSLTNIPSSKPIQVLGFMIF